MCPWCGYAQDRLLRGLLYVATGPGAASASETEERPTHRPACLSARPLHLPENAYASLPPTAVSSVSLAISSMVFLNAFSQNHSQVSRHPHPS